MHVSAIHTTGNIKIKQFKLYSKITLQNVKEWETYILRKYNTAKVQVLLVGEGEVTNSLYVTHRCSSAQVLLWVPVIRCTPTQLRYTPILAVKHSKLSYTTPKLSYATPKLPYATPEVNYAKPHIQIRPSLTIPYSLVLKGAQA